MSDEEITSTIERAVHDAIKTELGSYKVDKEQHYQDHIWLKELREWYGDIRRSFWKSLVGLLVTGLIVLMLFGFILWTKVNILGVE